MNILENMNKEKFDRARHTRVPLVENAVAHTIKNINEDKNTSVKDKQMLSVLMENSGGYFKMLKEDVGVSVDAIGNMISFAFPIIKKLFPGMIAGDLVPFQPVDAPVGFVRFLRYVRTGGKDPYSEAVMPENFLDSTYQPNYASQEITTTVIGTITAGAPGTMVVSGSDFTTSQASYGDIEVREPNTHKLKESTDNIEATVKSITVSDTTNYDADAFVVTNPSVGATNNYKIDDGANSLILTLTKATGAIAGGTVVGFPTHDVVVTVVLSAFINLESNAGADGVPEYKLKLEYLPVFTKPRMLRSSIELQSMLISQKAGVEADTELIDIISSAMALEIDRSIIAELREMAYTGSVVTPGTFDKSLPANWATSPAFYYAFLIKEMNVVSANIYKTSLRGKASWAVTTPEVASLLEITEMFDSNENFSGANVLTMAGKLKQNKISVYVDPYFPDNEMIMGFKGDGANAGYIFAPFIPLALTPPDFSGKNMSFTYGAFSQQGSVKVDQNIVSYITITT